MYFKYLALLIISCLSSSLFSQNTFFYETYHPDNNNQHEVFDTNPIEAGTTFDLTIEGTYSVWSAKTWSDPCGDIETAPMYPSAAGDITGHVGFDAEYMYSLPDLERCTSNEIPVTIVRMEISLDNGTTWFHPTTSDPYNAEHLYVYPDLVGEGYPIGIRQTSAMTFDDYGQLKLTIKEDASTSTSDDLAVEKETHIYPNPSIGIFTIENATIGSKIEVYNSAGVLLRNFYSENTDRTEINLTSFVSGIYFIKINGKVHKVVVMGVRA